jgi:hypothetical protein
MSVNVKTQFGAAGDGATDDTTSIQNAINYAKALTNPNGGAYRATVYFPAGSYYITQPINITNTTGILLMGDGGSYLNTIIVGNTNNGTTGRPMFDFSGSTLCGCESFSFLSLVGYANRSTIGVQFALTSAGGLNCGIRNCYFQMADSATANNTIGTIGILNIRSEEFYIDDCLIRTNAPIILSYSADLSQLLGFAYTATSAYQTLTSGTGSMGVVSIRATSLQAYEKRQPALLLNGTNSVNFQGYIGRTITLSGTSGGSNETAIYCNIYTTNLLVHATIESYSRVLKAVNGGFDNNELSVVIANQNANSTELIDVTGCNVRNLRARVNGPAGQPNRYVLYHAPLGGGSQGISTSVVNCEITCPDIPNQYMISPNLLKTSTNVVVNSNDPFEKRGGKIRQLYTNKVSAGTIGAVTTATIFRFQQANLLAFNNANAGFYRIWIDGVVRAGSYGSGNTVVVSFQAQVLVNQQYNGTIDPASVTIIILDKSGINPTAVDIAGLAIDISFSSGVGIVTLVPKVSGTATYEPLVYEGQAEIVSDFGVNDPIPLR